MLIKSMQKTRQLLASLSALLLTLAPLPSVAGLGDAEGGTKREFDAYCGKVGNNCKVLFTEDKLVVNGKDSISKSQMRSWSTSDEFIYFKSGYTTGQGTTLIIYEENGKEGSGLIIFVNPKTYREFLFAVTAFCGAGCRPIGPSVKIEQ
jgi:hypothetical protein